MNPNCGFVLLDISTHMPLARHDYVQQCADAGLLQFLLTCLLRGMTFSPLLFLKSIEISTHMPLARHDEDREKSTGICIISTHMPLARHDVSSEFRQIMQTFLLTCLLRGMTIEITNSDSDTNISTHMPLARHDRLSS